MEEITKMWKGLRLSEEESQFIYAQRFSPIDPILPTPGKGIVF